MRDALLDRPVPLVDNPSNVLVVDWRPSIFGLQARADARLAGVVTAKLLQFIQVGESKIREVRKNEW